MKIFKKVICTLLVVVLCLTSTQLQGFVGMEWPNLSEINFSELFGSKATAINEFATTGQCGENVYWNYDKETGLLSVYGTGSTYDYGYLVDGADNEIYIEPPFNDYYNYDIKRIEISEGITRLGNNIFAGGGFEGSIYLPNSIVEIGEGAFMEILFLSDIYIPDSVRFIGDEAFSYCYRLKSIRVSENNKFYSSDDFGVLYNKNKTKIIRYPSGSEEKNLKFQVL